MQTGVEISLYGWRGSCALELLDQHRSWWALAAGSRSGQQHLHCWALGASLVKTWSSFAIGGKPHCLSQMTSSWPHQFQLGSQSAVCKQQLCCWYWQWLDNLQLWLILLHGALLLGHWFSGKCQRNWWYRWGRGLLWSENKPICSGLASAGSYQCPWLSSCCPAGCKQTMFWATSLALSVARNGLKQPVIATKYVH